jgi:hypothetical protein
VLANSLRRIASLRQDFSDLSRNYQRTTKRKTDVLNGGG